VFPDQGTLIGGGLGSMFDYHVHTTRSADCNTPIADSCRAAITAGITEIAFTDHVEHELADMSYGFYDYDGFMEDIATVRDAYGDRLTILAGAEVDFNTRIRDDVEQWLESHPGYDFIIGSCHYGENGEIIFPEYFDDRSVQQVFEAYYEQLIAAAETGWFDTLGHIDLPKRYAPPAAGDYDPLGCEEQLRRLFQVLIDRGTSFEINTSGIRQAPKTSMPAGQIVNLYTSMGGKLITIGSDSHFAEHIGNGFAETIAMLQLCGIEELSSFRQRVRSQVPIASLRPV
jgi:histidinol-phosphatase (PHP family)